MSLDDIIFLFLCGLITLLLDYRYYSSPTNLLSGMLGCFISCPGICNNIKASDEFKKSLNKLRARWNQATQSGLVITEHIVSHLIRIMNTSGCLQKKLLLIYIYMFSTATVMRKWWRVKTVVMIGLLIDDDTARKNHWTEERRVEKQMVQTQLRPCRSEKKTWEREREREMTGCGQVSNKAQFTIATRSHSPAPRIKILYIVFLQFIPTRQLATVCAILLVNRRLVTDFWFCLLF